MPFRPYRVFYQSRKNGRTTVKDYPQDSIEYQNDTKSLRLRNANTPLHDEETYKIILEFEWPKEK